MNLKDGDKVTLDGVEVEVTEVPPDGYWLKQTGTSASYYYMAYRTKDEMEKLYKEGRLILGNNEKITGGDRVCHWHSWEKYVGIREVYDFCKNCGAKKHKDWRLIKDDKVY